MESQMARPHGHSHEQEPHIVENQMEGEDEHHHEKKSVLNKVKAKARKIKDSLAKHGYGHSHDHDLDEEGGDDDDEEMVEDPEIHAAPIYETAEIKSIGTMEASGQSVVNAGRSSAMDIDPVPPARTENPLAASHVHEQEENKSQPKVNVGLTSVTDEAPKAPQNTPVSHISTTTDAHHIRDQDLTRTFIPGQEEHSGKPKVNLQRPKGGLGEDPAGPKATPGAYTPSNYQTEVTDPIGKGGEEAGISPVLSSFEKMGISDESKSKSGQEQNWPTGTEDFYTSLPTGSQDQFSPELTPPKPVTGEAFHSTRTQDHPRDNSLRSISDESKSKSGQEQNWPTGTEDFYTGLPTGSQDQFSPELTPPKPVTGEAFHGTRTQDHPHENSLRSVSDESKSKSGQEQNWPTETEDFYTGLPTGSHDQFSPELTPPKPVTGEAFHSTRTQDHAHDNSAETKDALDSSRDNASDRQVNQRSYTEKASSDTSAIADKAISAKLGYGEQGDTGGHEIHATGDKNMSSMPASTVEYGKKIAVTVTEKLSPVYEKVAGAGSTLMAKIPGTNNNGSEKDHGVGGQDKGVSVKDYFAEKLRPGEEDRALSEFITEALHKKKAERGNKSKSSRPVTEVVSDALHKRKEEPDEVITSRPVGKVTESGEVARRLGTAEHDEGTDSSFVSNPDKGMVDKIKGAVGSWFGGKAEETRGSQQSHSAPIGSAFDEAGHNNNTTTGERRLQESEN